MPLLVQDRGLQFEIGHERLALADTALAWLSVYGGDRLLFEMNQCEPPRKLAVLLRALEGVDDASPFAYYKRALAPCRSAACLQPFLRAM